MHPISQFLNYKGKICHLEGHWIVHVFFFLIYLESNGDFNLKFYITNAESQTQF